ncbi:MAG: hypothetical protein H7Y02_04315 [Candidatus Obscuribacterales bacterium]|nr:hypothetical protein [Steroidobacteraceae bacterium]
MTAALSIISINESVSQSWTTESSVRVGGHYDDNIRLSTSDEQSGSSGAADAAFTLSRKDARLLLSLTPRLNYLRYSDQPLLDRADKFVALNGSYLGERMSWGGSSNYVRDNTLTSELGLSGIADVNRTHENLAVSLSPSWRWSERGNLSLNTAWSQHRYERPEGTGLTDYDYASASVSNSYALTSEMRFSVSVFGGALRVPLRGTVTKSSGAQAQLASQIDDLWSWAIGAGPTRVTTDLATDNGFGYNASLQRRGVLGTFAAAAGSDVIPTGRGTLSKRVHASLSLSQPLSEHLTASLETAWTRNRDIASTVATGSVSVRYLSTNTALRWQFTPTWSAWVSAGWVEQRYSLRDDAAEGLRGGMGFAWQGLERTH